MHVLYYINASSCFSLVGFSQCQTLPNAAAVFYAFRNNQNVQLPSLHLFVLYSFQLYVTRLLRL